jgi:hypothetical protein
VEAYKRRSYFSSRRQKKLTTRPPQGLRRRYHLSLFQSDIPRLSAQSDGIRCPGRDSGSRCLGHLNERYLRRITTAKMVKGSPGIEPGHCFTISLSFEEAAGIEPTLSLTTTMVLPVKDIRCLGISAKRLPLVDIHTTLLILSLPHRAGSHT